MNKSEIEKLAELSRIEISNEEKDSLLKDLQRILEYVDQIKEVKIPSDRTASPAHPLNVMRADEKPHEKGLYTEAILREMPETEGGYLKVRKIL